MESGDGKAFFLSWDWEPLYIFLQYNKNSKRGIVIKKGKKLCLLVQPLTTAKSKHKVYHIIIILQILFRSTFLFLKFNGNIMIIGIFKTPTISYEF